MSGTGTTVTVNEEPRVLVSAATVSTLISDLDLAGRNGVAVAVNGTVVPRAAWQAHDLRDGDRVLVIRATQGG